jgi:hypothetical protein
MEANECKGIWADLEHQRKQLAMEERQKQEAKCER